VSAFPVISTAGVEIAVVRRHRSADKTIARHFLLAAQLEHRAIPVITHGIERSPELDGCLPGPVSVEAGRRAAIADPI